MLQQIQIVDIELSRPLPTLDGLHHAFFLKGLVHWQGHYLGEVYVPIVNGVVSAVELYEQVLETCHWPLLITLLKNGLASPHAPKQFIVEELCDQPPMTPPPLLLGTDAVRLREVIAYKNNPHYLESVAIRTLDISQPIPTMLDVTDYFKVRIFIQWQQVLLGSVDITNYFQAVSPVQLCETIVQQLGLRLLEPDKDLSLEMRQARAIAGLRRRFFQHQPSPHPNQQLSPDVPVSIVIGTYDRPPDLRNCLQSLSQQRSTRPVEIIVVDNHPSSGITPPVLADFPQVKLVKEPRQGVAYARNAGIVASSGEIVVTVDDDITAPPDWLEKLLAPFAQVNVMAVTGNVLPLELETASQNFFENYGSGGLARGFERFTGDRRWFDGFQSVGRVVPTWDFGGTANAAFRATVFSHPQVGLMHEALGPGMPSGVGEDIYLFYRLLKANLPIVYEPKAFLWHKHRTSVKALRRQLYGYSKGYVSYQLTTLFADRDPNVIKNLLVDIPGWHITRIINRLRHRSPYPIPLVLTEIMGHLAGAWSLWMSHRRVQRQGRSQPYIPVSQRTDPSVVSMPATTPDLLKSTKT